MSQINSNTKDDFQVVFLLSCFVGHPVFKNDGLTRLTLVPQKSEFLHQNNYGFIITFITRSNLSVHSDN